MKEVCGDGIVCPAPPQNEQCELPNTQFCDGVCQVITAPSCGNGVLETGEGCDDGNTVAGDGCSPNCFVESCGNGLIDFGEQCDDGNANNGDGCSMNCQIEYCGNNVLDPNERCDGTAGTCSTGQSCNSACACDPPVCGNNVREGSEVCDGSDDSACSAGCDNSCNCVTANPLPPPVIPGLPPPGGSPPPFPPGPIQPPIFPPIQPPVTPLIPPSVEQPRALPSIVQPKHACVLSAANLQVERLETVSSELLPPGKEMAFGLKALNTGTGYYDITAAVSDVFSSDDTQVIKCSLDQGAYVCSSLTSTESLGARCGGISYTKLLYEQMTTRKETVQPAELESFGLKTKSMTPTDNIIEQRGYSAKLLSGAAKLSLGPVRQVLQQPENPNMIILNAMEITLPQGDVALPTRVAVALPSPLPENIDPYTISAYAWDGKKWNYLESILDLPAGKVFADLDLREFQTGDHIKIAAIATICHACRETKFDLVYDGGGEKVVVLVHGLTNQGIGTWAPLLKEMENAQLPIQVYVFSYPTWWTLERVSAELADRMQSQAQKYKIFPVGHSVGGLVIQQALYASNEIREQDPTKFSYLDKVRNGGAILLGTPNRGSPADELWKKLFSHVANLKMPLTPFNLNSPLLKDAVNGRLIPTVPGIKYYVLAGTKPFEFNLGFFTITTEQLVKLFQPNDGIITTQSAYTLGDKTFNNLCDNYFEMHLDHLDLGDHELSRRIINRIINQQFRDAFPPEEPLPGFAKYINFRGADWEKDDLFLVVSKQLPEKARLGALPDCNCGNGVCGEGETNLNCPADCFAVIPFCAAAPNWIYLLLGLTLSIFIIHLFRRKQVKNHRAHLPLFFLLLLAVLIISLVIYICREVPLESLLATIAIFLMVMIEGLLKPSKTKAPKIKPVLVHKAKPVIVSQKKPRKPFLAFLKKPKKEKSSMVDEALKEKPKKKKKAKPFKKRKPEAPSLLADFEDTHKDLKKILKKIKKL